MNQFNNYIRFYYISFFFIFIFINPSIITSTSSPTAVPFTLNNIYKISPTNILLQDNSEFSASLQVTNDINQDSIMDIIVGNPYYDGIYSNSGSVYIILLNSVGGVNTHQQISDTFSTFSTLLDAGDLFGKSVSYMLCGMICDSLTAADDDMFDSIEGIVIVGAPSDDDGNTGSGCIYLLYIDETIDLVTYNKISSTEGNFTVILDTTDNFGESVDALDDINGDDIDDIVVGAVGDDDGGAQTGAIYLLMLNTIANVDTYMKISKTYNMITLDSLSNEFGQAVSSIGGVNGDLDNDGIGDIMVGIPLDDDGGSDEGAVYILMMNTLNTIKTFVKISELSGGYTLLFDTFDYFGYSLSSIDQNLYGDIDGDDIQDILVGTPRDGDGGGNTGAMYIVMLNTTGTVKTLAKISATTALNLGPFLGGGDFCGSAVSSFGSDYDGDGYNDIVMGCQYDDDGGTNRGGFYILSVHHPILSTLAPTPAPSVSPITPPPTLSPTISPTPVPTISPSTSPTMYPTHAPTSESTIINGNIKVSSFFSVSSLSGSFTNILSTGDGFGVSIDIILLSDDNIDEIIVGASHDNTGGMNRGVVYILFMQSVNTVDTYSMISPEDLSTVTATDDMHFGDSLQNVYDLDNDDCSDIAVGASGYSDGGGVFIINLLTTGLIKTYNEISSTSGNLNAVIDTGDKFGSALGYLKDINDDNIQDIAVGSAEDNDQELVSGSCYLIMLTTLGSVQSYVKLSLLSGNLTTANINAGDRFGSSVSLVGGQTDDLNSDGTFDLVVGVPAFDGNSADTGAVFILVMNTSNTVSTFIQISDTSGSFTAPLYGSGWFGASISVTRRWANADIDGDNIQDILVGALREDNGTGALYIIMLHFKGTVKSYSKISSTDGSFLNQLKYTDNFGISVSSLDCDFNNDGIIDIMVGAWKKDDNVGAIFNLSLGEYIYINESVGIDNVYKISSTQGGFTAELNQDDFFGADVTILRDINHDLRDEIVVSTYSDDDGGTDLGAIYILFMYTSGIVNTYSKISKLSGGFETAQLDNYDWFGWAVSSVNDLDDDNIDDLVVGVIYDDDGNSQSGAVFVVHVGSSGFAKTFIKISSTEGSFNVVLDSGDLFGSSVCNLKDIDNDGMNDIGVGAFYDDDGSSNAGAVYLLMLETTSRVKTYIKISATSTFEASSLNLNDEFGSAISLIGGSYDDLDMDGSSDIMVGTWNDDDGNFDAGCVYIILMNSSNNVKTFVKISNTSGSFTESLQSSRFGYSLSYFNIGDNSDIDGDNVQDILVGAHTDGDGGSSRGAVYIIMLQQSGLVKTFAKISSLSDGFQSFLDDGDYFGSGISSFGYDFTNDDSYAIVIGSYQDDDEASNSGAFYILSINNAIITDAPTPAVTTLPPTQATTTVPPTPLYIALPPTILSSFFTPSGNGLEIVFDTETNEADQPSNFDCSLVFDDISGLGIDPYCIFTSSSSLEVTMGSSPTIGLNDQLLLNENIICTQDYISTDSCINSMIITFTEPYNLIPPTASITGSQSIGNCDDLILDGSQSITTDGRDLIYEWTLTNSNNGLTYLKEMVSNATSDILTIPKETWLFYGNSLNLNNFTFLLEITNYLGASDVSDMYMVSINPNATLVDVQIIGSSIKSITKSSSITIRSEASFPDCIYESELPNSELTYDWSLESIESDVLMNDDEISTYFSTISSTIESIEFSSSSPTSLILPGLTFDSGYEYTLKITSMLVGGSFGVLENSVYVTISVKSSNLIAIISGGNRLINIEDQLLLDGSDSYDPDNDNTLLYKWSCSKNIDEDCFATLDNDSVANMFDIYIANMSIEIPAYTLNVEEYYTFTLNIMDDIASRNASTSIVIQTEQGEIPEVTMISTFSNKVNNEDFISLEGSVAWSYDLNYLDLLWSSNDIDLTNLNNIASTSLSSTILVLSKNVLGNGKTYTFRLTASSAIDQIDEEGYAEISVTTNSAPSSGFITINPDNGQVLVTDFTLSMMDWADDIEDYPLTYRFFYYDPSTTNNGTNYLNSLSESTRLETVLPLGDVNNNYMLAVGGFVQDIYESSSKSEMNVIVEDIIVETDDDSSSDDDDSSSDDDDSNNDDSNTDDIIDDNIDTTIDLVSNKTMDMDTALREKDAEKLVRLIEMCGALLNAQLNSGSTSDSKTLRNQLITFLKDASDLPYADKTVVDQLASTLRTILNNPNDLSQSSKNTGLSLLKILLDLSLDADEISSEASDELIFSISDLVDADIINSNENAANTILKDLSLLSKLNAKKLSKGQSPHVLVSDNLQMSTQKIDSDLESDFKVTTSNGNENSGTYFRLPKTIFSSNNVQNVLCDDEVDLQSITWKIGKNPFSYLESTELSTNLNFNNTIDSCVTSLDITTCDGDVDVIIDDMPDDEVVNISITIDDEVVASAYSEFGVDYFIEDDDIVYEEYNITCEYGTQSIHTVECTTNDNGNTSIESIRCGYNDYGEESLDLNNGDEYIIEYQCPRNSLITECVWWNNVTDQWSSDGCEFVTINEGENDVSYCQCSHLSLTTDDAADNMLNDDDTTTTSSSSSYGSSTGSNYATRSRTRSVSGIGGLIGSGSDERCDWVDSDWKSFYDSPVYYTIIFLYWMAWFGLFAASCFHLSKLNPLCRLSLNNFVYFLMLPMCLLRIVYFAVLFHYRNDYKGLACVEFAGNLEEDGNGFAWIHFLHDLFYTIFLGVFSCVALYWYNLSVVAKESLAKLRRTTFLVGIALKLFVGFNVLFFCLFIALGFTLAFANSLTGDDLMVVAQFQVWFYIISCFIQSIGYILCGTELINTMGKGKGDKKMVKISRIMKGCSFGFMSLGIILFLISIFGAVGVGIAVGVLYSIWYHLIEILIGVVLVRNLNPKKENKPRGPRKGGFEMNFGEKLNTWKSRFFAKRPKRKLVNKTSSTGLELDNMKPVDSNYQYENPLYDSKNINSLKSTGSIGSV